jgi:hypothetical protein
MYSRLRQHKQLQYFYSALRTEKTLIAKHIMEVKNNVKRITIATIETLNLILTGMFK